MLLISLWEIFHVKITKASPTKRDDLIPKHRIIVNCTLPASDPKSWKKKTLR